MQEATRRERVVGGAVAAVCALAAGGLALTHEPEVHEGPPDGPAITIDAAVDPDSELAVEIVHADSTGQVHLLVSNDRPTEINAQCMVTALNAEGDSALDRSYEAIDDSGNTIVVEAYVKSFTILPEIEVRPGFTMEVGEPVESIQARCDVIPLPE